VSADRFFDADTDPRARRPRAVRVGPSVAERVFGGLMIAAVVAAIALGVVFWWSSFQRASCEALGTAMARDWQWSAHTDCLVRAEDGMWVPADALSFTEFVTDIRVDMEGLVPLPTEEEGG
jgi:hypothetical protein